METKENNDDIQRRVLDGSYRKGWEAPTDEVEKLSATLHDIYQKEAHRQEAAGIGPARHYDEYEKLSEPVKEFDRVLARHIIELLQKEKEKAREEGFRKGYADYNVNTLLKEQFEAGKSEAFSLVRKLIEQEKTDYKKYIGESASIVPVLTNILSLLSTLEGK